MKRAICNICLKEFKNPKSMTNHRRHHNKLFSKVWEEKISVFRPNPPSGWNRGISMTEEQKEKISLANTGKRRTLEFRANRSQEYRGKINLGENNGNWKGGSSSINAKIRESFEYSDWRKSVFEKDDYTCQGCGQVGGYLEADHIKPFSLYPELRFEVTNGRTFCKPCHYKLGWNIFRNNNPSKNKKEAVYH